MISSIERGIGKSINASAKMFSKSLDKAIQNPAKSAATMMVVSLVSKDAVNCYYYTTQSLHNKRIPEDKRKFVASLDLMNGILNVFTQILSFYIIDKKLTPKLFEKFFGKKLLEGNLAKYTKDVMKKGGMAAEKKGLVEAELKKDLNDKSNMHETLKTGFSLLASALATTALCKRTIVPFLSTPLAGWFKDNYLEKGKKTDAKTTETETAKTPDKADKTETPQSQNQYYFAKDKDFANKFGFAKNA